MLYRAGNLIDHAQGSALSNEDSVYVPILFQNSFLIDKEEADMLLHLPIVVLATLSPVAVSDTVPTFDIVKECRSEGGSADNVEQCSRDEAAALGQLKTEWAQSIGAEKRTCMVTTQIGGFASYVELLTCLEMTGGVTSPSR